MMGDRDYRRFIRDTMDSISAELRPKIDGTDTKTIHIDEVARCMRRSYYDRNSPLTEAPRGFNDLLAGMLRKLGYAPDQETYDLGGINLAGRADMIVDDIVMIFRPAEIPPEIPDSGDLIYLNACMWIHEKTDGVIVYVTGDANESSFSLTRDKKMFEETVRRVRVLGDLLAEGGRTPILEPSGECASCQYYERCYTKERVSKPIKISDLVGMGKEK